MKEGFQQYCALARALDVVGNRWALLIVRELRPGPRRFTDLVDGLPGISRKLLTDRLRELERDGILARTELPPPAARQVYELTEDGRDLADAMIPLISWGAKRLREPEPTDTFRARWAGIGMASLADREAAKGVNESYQYLIDDSAFYLTVDDGSVEVHDGRVDDPSVVVTSDEQTWTSVVTGKTKTSAAQAAGALTITGDREALQRFRTIFARERMLGYATAAGATTISERRKARA